MLNPVDVERRFIHVQHLLAGHLSFRQQWFIISEFLESVRDHFETYDTHCEQLAAQLPVFSHPLSMTGTDPARLISILDLLSDLEQVVPEIKEAGDYLKAKESLKIATGFLFVCLSEWRLANQAVGLAEDPSDNNYKNAEEYFWRLKTSDKYSLDKACQSRVDRINNWWEIANKPKKNSLFVPVVENEDDSQKFGRIRKLSASVMGRHATRDYFRNSYSVIGAEGQDAGLSPIIEKTTRYLLDSSHPGLKQDFFEVQFDYQVSYGVQKGRSAELASSLTAYTTILDTTRPRETYALKNGVAVTGQLFEDSVIGPVEQTSIEPKVRAAFFSWIDILVVPDLQKKMFTDHLDRLKEQYPSKILKIIGLDEPRAFFYDRRLSDHQKDSIPIHAAKQVWENKFSAVGVVVILLLMTALGRLMYGPIDKNPEIGNFNGKQLSILNSKNQEIYSIEVGTSPGAYNERYHSSISMKPQVQFYDINNDEINEIFYYQAPNDAERRPRVIGMSASGDSLIWSRPLDFETDYPMKPAIVGNQYRLNELYAVKNQAGEAVLIVSLNLETYFPALLVTINAKSGDVIHKYAHPGYFGDILPIDLTSDGTPEIIATGVNNAFDKAFITALKIDSLQGHAPTQGDYILEDSKLADHFAYMLVPKSIVGQKYESENRFNFGAEILSSIRNELIDIRINEVRIDISDDGIRPGLVITLNQNFEPVGIGTDDRYDIISNQLFEDGEIPFVPGFEYFEAFKDSLLYWDGEEGEFKRPK